MNKKHPTRRTVLKKALYTAPVLLTLPALPSFAAAGSGQPAEDPQGGIRILPVDDPPTRGLKKTPPAGDPPTGVKPLPVEDPPQGKNPKKKGKVSSF